MIKKIEINDLGEIVHAYTIFTDAKSDPHCPNGGLIVDESGYDLFDEMMGNSDLFFSIYKYKNGRFEKEEKSIVDAKIVEWVDNHPIELSAFDNKNPDGTYKSKTKSLEDLSPEELNAIAKPIPKYEDFLEISSSFIKRDLYEEKFR